MSEKREIPANCPECNAETRRRVSGHFSIYECGRQFVVDFQPGGLSHQTEKCRVGQLEAAIRTHRDQKADDRCIEDDDRLYAVLRDGIACDRRVGDKAAMLANCQRFIERRCEGGGWPSYAELEQRLAQVAIQLEGIVETSGDDMGVVYLSVDGRTHPEVHNGETIQVYDHQYFSPLGDALIAVWKLAKGDTSN